jgi:phenylacetate-CoA ligase
MKSNDVLLSVLVPCFNEEGNLLELVTRIQGVFERLDITGEVILVDDASTDTTGDVLIKLANDFACVRACFHKDNKGMFAAWKTALGTAQGQYVCLIDADLQNLPEDIARLYEEIVFSHADIVQGVRSSIGRIKDGRYTLSRGLNFLLNLFFGMKAKDNKSGFILTRKAVLADILSYRKSYYYPQSFLSVSAHAKGYRVVELDTFFESRLTGKSFIAKNPFWPVFFSLIDIVVGLFEFRIFFKQETTTDAFLRTHTPTKVDAPLPWHRRFRFWFYFFTLPLHAWMITGNTKKYYYELKKTQWLSQEDIKKFQEIKLQRIVAHAYHHVRYYRKLFNANGIKPEDIKTIADLQKIPLLDKATIRKNIYFDMLSDNYDPKKILKVTTSGSTGEPFVCFADKHQLEIRWAATLRSMEWTGYRFGDKQLRLWHQTLGMSLLQIVREYIDAFLSRRKFVPAYEMSEKHIDKFIKKLKRYKPVFIDGYAESFNLLSSYLVHKGVTGLPKLKGIISSAQVLPTKSREIIENAFGCKVFDKYGSREFSGIAYESDGHDGHLVVAENYIVEILKNGVPALPGETGEVVITDLNNLCMPFIRYRVGDLAVAMDNSIPSPCGRGLPRIGAIEGRVQAIIVGSNGSYVPGTFFAHMFKDYDHIIRQYKVIQEVKGSIILQIVKANRFTESGFNNILSTLRDFLGQETNIEIQFLEDIPMVRTGKQQGSISKVAFDFQTLEGVKNN